MNGTELARTLRRWRGGLRQKEAAAILDLPLPTYRKYECGKRTPNKLALAELERRLIDKARDGFLPGNCAVKIKFVKQI